MLVVILASTCAAALAAPETLESMAAEYRELRKVKGHFGGGEWRDDVDRWAGRKHELMAKLGEELGAGKHLASEIEKLMGPPDEVLGRDSVYWKYDDRLHPEATRMLVYLWRGHHDFLYFMCKGDRVLGRRWFMAGE